jgi:hypothetical protein
MPSGRNGRDSHPETPIPRPASGAPTSGARPPSSSARPPAENVAWGAVRDAITALHNFELLLKSPRVGTKLLGEVLHEFVAGIAVLRGAFTRAAQSAKDEGALAARKSLADFTCARLDELERTMQQAMAADFDTRGRLTVEQVVTRVSVDLDVAAELLDLSERAEHAMETELTLDELATVSLRGGAYGTDREIPVRLVARTPEGSPDDCILRTDPHVFKRLVAFAIARVHAAGPAEVSLRALSGPVSASIEVGPTSPLEQSIVPTSLRLVRRIGPTDAIVEAAARTALVALSVSPGEIPTIRLEVPRIGQ